MQASLDEAAPERETVVALGTFDGLHLGHRLLLGRARALAKEGDLLSVALTFPKPPRNYLGRGKRLILPPELKIRLLEEEVELVVVADFLKLQPLAPEEFARILKERLWAAVVVVGKDYRFGRDRRGDVDLLRELGQELGFRVEALAKLLIDGRPVSSTAVREAIAAGKVDRARRLLGYPPLLRGPVIRGEGRGKELGFPTANLKIDEELVAPKEGVFAVRVRFKDQLKQGLLYIGRRPTFAGGGKSFEVYILDFKGELYSEELEVHLLKRLRGDLKFDDPHALQRQIEQDVRAAREFLAQSSDEG
jgi:riboflavin kinase/FMN adenylyltransferase